MPDIWHPELIFTYHNTCIDMEGCSIRHPDTFEDERGYLFQILSEENPKVLYCYYSATSPGCARDIDKWHYHEKHTDRFVVLQGSAVFALARQDDMQIVKLDAGYPAVLTVNPDVYHCFRVYGIHPVGLLNVPDAIYDPKDEYRISFDELGLHPW